ncbi:type III PLP-dependent enzyme [Aliiglaciecola sp. LCG003]|uniref:type III PLP-dependent enzyme n=1 Tax=Aliiglaciecola sp. LCG003 TaxID=3053655 RepID=UPI002573DFE2|nr:type III PLP-dependent enzyme [Aliiglaciecola sp. LCG003]WJG11188.1 type III PLP-dependent enzyme [Aliiglaciecola sp. LCG003]
MMESIAQLKKHVTGLLHSKKISTPALVISLDLIERQFDLLQSILPRVEVHFSVKANPDRAVLSHLRHIGSSFEAASLGEIKQCLEAGSLPTQIHFGNSIKKRIDIKEARSLGITSFSVDSEQEVLKIAEMAPGSKVIVRLTTDGKGAIWGLTKKFGTSVDNAIALLKLSKELNLQPYGLSFHVGSQQMNPQAWSRALNNCQTVISELSTENINLTVINLGGGLPANGYLENGVSKEIDLASYLKMIRCHIEQFENDCGRHFKFMIEPGRFMVANTGLVVSEVVLDTTRESDGVKQRWIYMDVGKFNGLYEASDVSLPVHVLNSSQLHATESTMPMILSGPSCDSDDMLLPNNSYVVLPTNLKEGDHLVFSSTGAYSNSYATRNFNGLNPIEVVCLNGRGDVIKTGTHESREIFGMVG